MNDFSYEKPSGFLHFFSTFLLPTFLLVCFLNQPAFASKTDEIDAKVKASLATFYALTANSKDFVQGAKGILVFPEVTSAGFILGGEYGEGALVVNGYVEDYFSVTGASLGFQAGVQVHSKIVLFLTDEALASFKRSNGWEFGLEGSVAVATEGAGGQVDNRTMSQPVVVYVYDNKGLMLNLSLGASKVARMQQ